MAECAVAPALGLCAHVYGQAHAHVCQQVQSDAIKRMRKCTLMCKRTSGVSAGDGASSSSFWLRRWMEQSRSPRWITLPCLSASTWNSMWRGFLTRRSM
eukprot:10175-Chlamydomonas_euryale.AAC.5